MKKLATLITVLAVASVASAESMWGVCSWWDTSSPLGATFKVDLATGAVSQVKSFVGVGGYGSDPDAAGQWASAQSMAVNAKLGLGYVAHRLFNDPTDYIGVIELSTLDLIADVAVPRRYSGMSMKDGKITGMDPSNGAVYNVGFNNATGIPTGLDSWTGGYVGYTGGAGHFYAEDTSDGTNPNSRGAGYYAFIAYQRLTSGLGIPAGKDDNPYTGAAAPGGRYGSLDYSSSGEFDATGQLWTGYMTNYNLYNWNCNVNNAYTVIYDLSTALGTVGGAGIYGLARDVPEPATLSVLALGALAVIRRRR